MEDRAPHPLPHHRQYDQYVSTTDPARAQTVDTDIAKHCASSLPAVALALGRPHWHSLKDTYETLASDVQRKVRRTLAFSVHEPAVILGNQLTAADRVPIFNGFLKDLDAVRTGVLRHLCAFLKVVAILQKFRSNSESALGLNFIKELTLRFGHCSKWVGRQAWAFMCQVAQKSEASKAAG